MQLSVKVLSIVLLSITVSLAHAVANEDIDPLVASEGLERVKRWLNYPINGGVAKMVLGFIVPIRFHHPLPRAIVNTCNLQANYRIPAQIIYPQAESVFKNRALSTNPGTGAPSGVEPTVDQSRRQFFELLEKGMVRWGRNGRACLLRAVCEVAETPLKHNGLIGEIIDVIFTPTPSDRLDPEYHLAQLYGQQGRNCSEHYPACPAGQGLFDNISFLTSQQPQSSLEV
uniref:Uncharacterized protein n=1 Tax=Anopheles farauti TaxID=69004 RepID=A0A182QFX3_9DIPT